jgi:PncC family amidohydrolase
MEHDEISSDNYVPYGTQCQGIEDAVGALLVEKKLSISVAESCTGGLIGHLLTNVPGSSSYFLGGVTAYTNQAKVDLLEVSSEILEEFGAVSEQTVLQMARGVRRLFNSMIGVAVSGIAGPDGGSREKPVGTVYIGMDAGDESWSERYLFKGSRQQIKLYTAETALEWVRRYLNGDPFVSCI